MNEEQKAICTAYEGMGKEVLCGKGGFWLRGEGFRPLRQARKETGINMAKPRGPRTYQQPYGDYAMLMGFFGGQAKTK